MPKPMRIRMQYRETGKVYHWTIRKATDGWAFYDHDNYARFVEGNWQDLVARFQLVADNYGMDCNIS